MRNKGVNIRSIGQVKYAGIRAFERYAIDTPLTRTETRVEMVEVGGMMVAREVTVKV